MTARHVLILALPFLPVGANALARIPPLVEENVVVTATLSPEEETEIGTATTVISRERIERSGATTVLDLLRLVPGVDVVQSGTEGAVTSVFLRGASPVHALVLVNGVRVNSPFFAGYDFSALTVENVQRVEVARGPFSPLYGSDAVGGVIQIFTRPATASPSALVTLEGGGSGQAQGSLFASTGEGPVALTASYRHARADGGRDNSLWKERNGSARVDLRAGPRVHAALEASVLDGETGVPGPVGKPSPHARGTLRESRLSVPLSFEPFVGHEASAVIGRVDAESTFRDPDFGSSESDARTLQVRVSDTWRTGSHRLTVFASWERFVVDAASSFGPSLDGDRASNWGLGLQDSFRFPRRWSATFGARIDRHSEFGSAVSPRASVSWLSERSRWKLRGSVGTAFRAPSIGELFYPGSGNADLEPERSRSYEIGLERYVKTGRAEVSVFWNEFRDLILYDFVWSQNENIGRASTRGVELGWRQDLSERAGVDAGYTWLATENRGDGAPLLRRPRHRGYVAAHVRPTPRLRLTVSALFVGRRDDVDPVAFGRGRIVNPSYERYDLFVRYSLPRWVPYLRVENVTDEDYEEAAGYPAPGRRVAAGIELRL